MVLPKKHDPWSEITQELIARTHGMTASHRLWLAVRDGGTDWGGKAVGTRIYPGQSALQSFLIDQSVSL